MKRYAMVDCRVVSNAAATRSDYASVWRNLIGVQSGTPGHLSFCAGPLPRRALIEYPRSSIRGCITVACTVG